MCGIVGYIGQQTSKEERLKTVRKIGLLQYHRGPDYWGEFNSEKVTFGHNRLSIIDLTTGNQPMTDSTDRLVIVFNGEIYNYLGLKDVLISKGHIFNTKNSDTEVILNGYLEWGTSFFKQMNGMFAFALFDKLLNKVYLVRDRVGIKPLYYVNIAGNFVFCSEPKGLLSLDFVKKEISVPQAVEYFHFRAAIGENTLIKNVKKVLAGTFLEFDLQTNKISTNQFFKLGESPGNSNPGELEKLIDDSVKIHMISDAPLGIFLSGGVDSSVINFFAKKENSNINAFNIGVHSSKDETQFAKIVSKQLGINLNTKYVSGKDFYDKMDEWSFFNDDPVSDPSALALMILSQFAHESNYKVMLAGEGADELFGGYYSYLRYVFFLKYLRPLPSFILNSRFFSKYKLTDFVNNEINPNSNFLGTANVTNYKEKLLLFSDKKLVNSFYSKIDEEFQLLKGSTRLKKALLIDQAFRLPNDLLSRTDRATMANSIESRVPFLENNLIDFSSQIDDKFLINTEKLDGKLILKTLSLKLFPSVITKRKKVGFELPMDSWIENELKPIIEERIRKKELTFIDYNYIQNSVNKLSNTAMIWAWLVIEGWNEKWLQGSIPENPRLIGNKNIHESYLKIM